jgi:hypothetical protein
MNEPEYKTRWNRTFYSYMDFLSCKAYFFCWNMNNSCIGALKCLRESNNLNFSYFQFQRCGNWPCLDIKDEMIKI